MENYWSPIDMQENRETAEMIKAVNGRYLPVIINKIISV